MASDATLVGATSDSASISAFTDDRAQHVMGRIIKHWGNRMLSAAFQSLLAHWRLQKAHRRVSRVSSAGSQSACAGMLPEDAHNASCGRFSRVSSTGSKNASPDAASSGDEADKMVTMKMLREQDQEAQSSRPWRVNLASARAYVQEQRAMAQPNRSFWGQLEAHEKAGAFEDMLVSSMTPSETSSETPSETPAPRLPG